MANIVVLDDDSDLCSFVKTALERDLSLIHISEPTRPY